MTRDNEVGWILDASDGELLVRTDVTGPAAKMGHRLMIAMQRWQATVRWAAGQPVTAELAVEVDSLQVLRGEGGVTPLSGPEKILVRSNALRSLDAGRFPEISFVAEAIDETRDGYRLTGRLQVRGKAREQVIELRTEDLGGSWRMSGDVTVRHADFGVKPYSLLMGSLKVADAVAVSFTAQRAKY